MKSKQELLANLEDALEKWESFLGAQAEAELAQRRYSGNRSIKDVVAHLMAWQQVTRARLEAARTRLEPRYPEWLGDKDPFYAEEHVDQFNARIYDMYRDQPWPTVHREWKTGFLRVVELAQAIRESELTDANRFSWLNGDPLSAVLEGTCEHHQEHLERVLSQR